MVVARITAPNRYDSNARRSAVARIEPRPGIAQGEHGVHGEPGQGDTEHTDAGEQVLTAAFAEVAWTRMKPTAARLATAATTMTAPVVARLGSSQVAWFAVWAAVITAITDSHSQPV